MSKSSRLRLRDVRAAFRLIGDCRDTGRDPTAWNPILVRGLTATFGCYMSNTFLGTYAADQPIRDVAMLADDWPDNAGYRWWLGFVREESYRRLPSTLAHTGPFDRTVTARREEILPTAEWLLSAERNDIRARCEQGEFIYSGAPIAGPKNRFLGITLNRPVGEPAFTVRERNLATLIHEEVAALVGTRLLVTPLQLIAELSPRLREVLAALLEGDSEKQVGARLGLSRHTVHEYVIALYRRFGVRSRVDLIRTCLRPPGEPGG